VLLPDYLEFTVNEMCSMMRLLSDLWIDSGKEAADNGDIQDNPKKRSIDAELPESKGTLHHLLDLHFLNVCAPLRRIKSDGTQELIDVLPELNETNELRWGSKAAFRAYGAALAAFRFSRLLKTKYSRCLSRCDFCGRHFAYNRPRLREVIHKVNCPDCKGRASMERADLVLNRLRAEKYETAAKAVQSFRSSRRKGEEWRCAVRAVNSKYRTTYGRRWYTTNKAEILRRVDAMQ
jgi:hypothetical protein